MVIKNKINRCRHLKSRKVSTHCHFMEFNWAAVCIQQKHFCSGASPCGYPWNSWLSKQPPGHRTQHINIHSKVTLVVQTRTEARPSIRHDLATCIPSGMFTMHCGINTPSLPIFFLTLPPPLEKPSSLREFNFHELGRGSKHRVIQLLHRKTHPPKTASFSHTDASQQLRQSVSITPKRQSYQ